MSDKKALPKKPQGTPIKDYLESRDFHFNRTWVLSDGILLTQINGEWLNEQEFSRRYPIKTRVNFSLRPSPDSTKNFLF